MPEFAIGQPLLPNPRANDPRELIGQVRSALARRERMQTKIDDAFFATLKDTTGVDLSNLNEAHKRDGALAAVVGELPALLTDALLTSSTSAGADLPAGIGPTGRPVGPNQNGSVSATVDDGGQQPVVVMLPMWAADP